MFYGIFPWYESGIVSQPAVLKLQFWNSNYCSLLANALFYPGHTLKRSKTHASNSVRWNLQQKSFFLVSNKLRSTVRYIKMHPATHFSLFPAKRRMDVLSITPPLSSQFIQLVLASVYRDIVVLWTILPAVFSCLSDPDNFSTQQFKGDGSVLLPCWDLIRSSVSSSGAPA